MSKAKQLLRIFILFFIGIVFLLTTNPKNIASILLIVPFVFFFFSIFFAVLLLFEGFNNDAGKKNIFRKRVMRPRLVAVLTAGFPILLLILQSIGQLTVRDTITACVIFLLAYFYIAKSAPVTPYRH